MIDPIIKIGEIEIWRVVDTENGGCVPTDTFPKADQNVILENKSWLYPYYIDSHNNFIMAIQSFIIKIENTIILVNGGVGNGKVRYTSWANKLKTDFIDNLNSLGFNENNIKIVLTTHLHMDHVGWFTHWDKDRWVPTFPNAEYYFVKSEYSYWKNTVDPKNLDNNISLLDSIEPIVLTNQVNFVSTDFHFNESIYLESVPGHTPGHVLIHVKSGENHIIIAGDIFHHPIQINKPYWTADYYDVDIKQALETRVIFLNKYVNTGTIIIGLHFASQPAGLITEKSGNQIFLPIKK